MKQVNIRKPLAIIQMREFHDYKSAAKKLQFSIPYTTVKLIVYTNTESAVTVEYGLSFDQKSLTKVAYDEPPEHKLRVRTDATAHNMMQRLPFPSIKTVCSAAELSPEKVADLRSMLKFMDDVDVKYYETILKSQPQTKQVDGESTVREDDGTQSVARGTCRRSQKQVRCSTKRKRQLQVKDEGDRHIIKKPKLNSGKKSVKSQLQTNEVDGESVIQEDYRTPNNDQLHIIPEGMSCRRKRNQKQVQSCIQRRGEMQVIDDGDHHRIKKQKLESSKSCAFGR